MTQNKDSVYRQAHADNNGANTAQNNVFGHALAVLARNLADIPNTSMSGENLNVAAKAHDEGALHIDIGCGYGVIAEQIRDQLGLVYVGVDGNSDAMRSLQSRGFECHENALNDEEALVSALEALIGNRQLVSITMLDRLAHLPSGDGILRALGRIAKRYSTLFVLSVPNVAHQDVGFKLAMGSWDYTDAGLLDHTHGRLFDHKLLVRALRRAGWHIVDEFHIEVPSSDQNFPSDHPAVAAGTLIRQLLQQIRDQVDEYGLVSQFVVACLPGPVVDDVLFIRGREEPRPFLSVVVRTQGNRRNCLAELMVCFAGQTSKNFEVILVGHKLTPEGQKTVEQVVEIQPEWLRQKIKFVREDQGNRVRPLNTGFSLARGNYIAIHDDDDTPFGHWVESFEKLHAKLPGRILRCVSVRQDVELGHVLSKDSVRATGSPKNEYPPEFELIQHFSGNCTPNNTVAFPRGAFHTLNMRFDEQLSTTEDWDYILRVASVLGVASSADITGIYRWWTDAPSSRSAHSKEEWAKNHAQIDMKTDSRVALLPPTAPAQLRRLLRQVPFSASEDNEAGRVARLNTVQELLRSTSWRVSSPIRLVGSMLGGGRSPDASLYGNLGEAELDAVIANIRASSSWRYTRWLRALRRR